MPETIDEKKFTLTWKVAIPIMISLLVISNTFTLQISEIDQNKGDIVSIEKKAARRLEHAIEKQDFKNEIKDLTKELKECKDARK